MGYLGLNGIPRIGWDTQDCMGYPGWDTQDWMGYPGWDIQDWVGFLDLGLDWIFQNGLIGPLTAPNDVPISSPSGKFRAGAKYGPPRTPKNRPRPGPRRARAGPAGPMGPWPFIWGCWALLTPDIPALAGRYVTYFISRSSRSESCQSSGK